MKKLLLVFVCINAMALQADGQTYENPFHEITTRHDIEPVLYPEKIMQLLNDAYEEMPLSPTYIRQSVSGDTTFLDVYAIRTDSNDTRYLDATKKFWSCANGLLIPVYADADMKQAPAGLKAPQKLRCRVAYVCNAKKETRWTARISISDETR